MKKMIACVALLSSLLLTGSYSLETVNGRQIDDSSPNRLSFASIGAIFLESRLDAWATIDSTFLLNNADFENVINSLKNQDFPEWTSRDRPGMIEKSCDMGKVKCTLTGREIDGKKTLVLVSVSSMDALTNMKKYAQVLSETSTLNWHFNYTYTGEIETAIDQAKMSTVSEALLKNMEAVPSSEFRQQGTFSIEARRQTPANCRGCGNVEKIQLAMRSDNTSGKTKIWIGIPFVMNDY